MADGYTANAWMLLVHSEQADRLHSPEFPTLFARAPWII